MKLSLQTINGEVWTGTSLFFGGLALARAIRRSRNSGARLIDYDRYDYSPDNGERLGWTESESDFLALCADAGETAWYRRHVWEVAGPDGRRHYAGRMLREQAERLASLKPGLIARKIIF